MTHSLMARLRTETHHAHERLEAGLDLLAPPFSQARFTKVLLRFNGFHVVWEPAVAALEEVAPVFAGRSRRPHLARDLAALGLAEPDIARAPRCVAARALASDAPLALGSLYVLEGSTLGGQVISRALQAAEWLPAGGLSYFAPHGANTGAMWRTLMARLDAVPAREADRVVEGALKTFAVLQDWVAAPSSRP